MRLIDANALTDYVNSISTHWLNDWSTIGVLAAIDKQPTIDAVPVVRCGLCRYCDTKDCPMSGTPGSVSVSDFCSYGERRDDDAGDFIPR